MKNKIEINLPEKWIKKLQKMPETGMGYQLVDLTLTTGKVLKNITVFNCSIALLEEKIDISQIENIELSDKRK